MNTDRIKDKSTIIYHHLKGLVPLSKTTTQETTNALLKATAEIVAAEVVAEQLAEISRNLHLIG